MSHSYYELHVTIDGYPAPDKDRVRVAVEGAGWTYSAIDGDPILGAGVKQYGTKQMKSSLPREEVLTALHRIADHLALRFPVVRRKVELVLFDDRSSGVDFSCGVGCRECMAKP